MNTEQQEQEETQILDPELKALAKSEILEDKEYGQHRILEINAQNYDDIVGLCKAKGYGKILKAKRRPYRTHANSCLWVTSRNKETLRVPCNCYYFGDKGASLPAVNRWQVTVMA
jgi:hypothetical protein